MKRYVFGYGIMLWLGIISGPYTTAQEEVKSDQFLLEPGWNIKLGYSQSAQSYSFTSFQFTPYYQNVHFFYIGADYRFLISKNQKHYLSVGAEFIKRGRVLHYEINDQSTHTITKIDNEFYLYYLDCPVYFQTGVWKSMWIQYGLVPSFMLYNVNWQGYGREGNYLPVPYQKRDYHYLEKDLNYVDIHLQVGISFRVYKHLYVEANYKRGLINVNRFLLSELGYQNVWMLGLKYSLSRL